MATQPPIGPDTIDPQSPQEAPAVTEPVEQPVPSEPMYDPDGGDIDQPGRGPDEVPPDQIPGEGQKMGFDVPSPPSENVGPLDK